MWDEEDEPERNPVLISGLWAEWVCVVCDRKNIPWPTLPEWTALKAKFHYDKAPVDSVAELEAMRKTT